MDRVAEQSQLKTVVLNERHVALGGRMVEFAGYSLPVQYPSGILAEHSWTREHASLFDVSHMGPSLLLSAGPHRGDKAAAEPPDGNSDHAALAALVEPLVSADIVGLKSGQLRYTVLLNEDGGVLDDLMIGREDVGLYIVVNAATKDVDFRLIEEAAGVRPGEARLQRLDEGALLALQGPEAAEVIAGFVPGAARLGFMQFAGFAWGDALVRISRSGYTGEDGFEIQVDAEHAPAIWDALVGDARVKPAGLGARDSLRLEAGLPLYGHDLDATISPIEAGLAFAISKRRRTAGDLRGASRLLLETAGTLSRMRVGILVDGAPAREGARILDGDDTDIGFVTSGGFSPTLGRPIAMGFVPPEFSEPGTPLRVVVRGRGQPARVTPLPFVPHRYYRPSSK
jgi:aminomethyltransferase